MASTYPLAAVPALDLDQGRRGAHAATVGGISEAEPDDHPQSRRAVPARLRSPFIAPAGANRSIGAVLGPQPLQGGFEGPIMPVNPQGGAIAACSPIVTSPACRSCPTWR